MHILACGTRAKRSKVALGHERKGLTKSEGALRLADGLRESIFEIARNFLALDRIILGTPFVHDAYVYT